MRRTFVIFFILFSFFSCKKKDNIITFSGTITNTNLATPASGVTVKLSAQLMDNQSFSVAYTTLATTTTDASGHYSISLERPNGVSYKISLSSPNHFPSEKVENSETIARNNERDFLIDPASWFSIHVKNFNPLGSDDNLLLQYVNETTSCGTCCNSTIRGFYGPVIDTVMTCPRVGGSNINLNWTVIKGGQTNSYTNSVFVNAFDTTYYDLFY